MERNRRIQTRKNIKIPILHTKEYENIYHPAQTCDISVGGLSFRSDQKFSNGDCFLIKPMDRIPGFEPVPRDGRWTAQVQWCVKNDGETGYKVGIRRTKSTDFPKASPELQCELCGRAIEAVVSIQCGANLCPRCFMECYQPAGETLRGTIGRFMSGNVI